MMATNEILPFAQGGGANVQSQSAYAAEPLRSSGNVAGIARSNVNNKALRQASAIAAGVAQFMADNQGTNITDSLTAAQISAILGLVCSKSSGPVGESRNAVMQISTASASGTFTADNVIVGESLSGQIYRIAGISETINLATTGVGGMDVGLAPASGFVALYLIYNPTTLDVALLARDATSVAAPEIYGGANMPAGYTASALVGVIPTNASRQFVVSQVNGRNVSIEPVTILNGSSTQRPAYTSQSISQAVPINAKSVSGLLNVGSNATSSSALNIGGSNAFGQQGTALNHIGAGSVTGSFSNCPIRLSSPQTILYSATTTGGTMSASIFVSGYTF